MAKEKRPWISLVLAIVIVGGVFLGIKNAESNDVYTSISKNLTVLGRIYKEVSRRYVDEVQPDDFLKSGIDGMLNTLDPYTSYLEEREEQHQLEVITHGRYGGVGIPLNYRNNRVTVTDPPFLGTPAARSGIREGDIIVEVDGIQTQDLGFNETAKSIRGEPGTEVTLKIRREGEPKLLEFTLVREQIKVDDIRYSGMIDDEIGYVQLTRFTSNATTELTKAIQDLKSQDMKGLILDLRSNPGGLLDAAVRISDLFLPKGKTIVSTRGRMQGSTHEFKASLDPIYGEGPLIVLVNRISASASEIVAGAVQDNDRGVVVGDTTFGKGLVQTVIPFSPSSALRITTAKYYTPSGRCIQKQNYSNWADTVTTDDFFTVGGRPVHGSGGIAPDIIVRFPPVSDFVADLRRRSQFFNFAVHYTSIHTPPSGEFQVDDQIIEAFREYLDHENYTFSHPIERSLIALEDEASEGGYDGTLIQDIQRLRSSLEHSKRDMFTSNVEDIKSFLRLEIGSKFYGTRRGVELGFVDDVVVQKAVELIKDQQTYAGLLPGEQ